MALGSVLQTAWSGMAAAEVAVGVLANNLANARTPGFKQSRPSFTTQTPQTLSSGAAPSARNGGANPVQIGAGVRTAAISTDFTQGSLAMDAGPLNLALQGEGLFILEGPQNGRVYTRDGSFRVNANRELVSSSGQRVLGFAADDNFQIQTGELTPLKIPVGRQVADVNGAAATLTDFSIGQDGRIIGRFTDGVSRDLGQIAIARFANPAGLQQTGNNQFAAGPNSGLPVEGVPGEAGSASIVSGATELSNTDIGRNLVDLSQASNLFRANVQVLATGEAMFDELTNLLRPK